MNMPCFFSEIAFIPLSLNVSYKLYLHFICCLIMYKVINKEGMFFLNNR